MDWEFRMLICVFWRFVGVDVLSERAKLSLRKLLVGAGYTGKAADELWKWYDFYDKKGVASF